VASHELKAIEIDYHFQKDPRSSHAFVQYSHQKYMHAKLRLAKNRQADRAEFGFPTDVEASRGPSRISHNCLAPTRSSNLKEIQFDGKESRAKRNYLIKTLSPLA
jgi:hypothetical protein